MLNIKKFLPKKDSTAAALLFASALLGVTWLTGSVVNERSRDKSSLNIQQVWFDSEKRQTSELDSLLSNLDPSEGLESELSIAYEHAVVFVGENHADTSDDLVFGNFLLPILKNQGFNDLALEIDSSCQKIIDKFFNGETIVDQMAQSLLESNNKHNKYFFNLYSFALIIGKAKALDIKVHCVDHNYSFDESQQSDWYNREKMSLDKITKRIYKKNPDSKLIVFYGAAHGPKIEDYQSLLSDLSFMEKGPMDYCATIGDRLKEMLTIDENHDPIYSINLTNRELLGYDVDLTLRLLVSTPRLVGDGNSYGLKDSNPIVEDSLH